MTQENNYHKLFDLVPDLVCKLDGQGKIIETNSAVSLFGYSKEEFIGKELIEFIKEADRDLYEKSLDRQTSVLFNARHMDAHSYKEKFIPTIIVRDDPSLVIIKDISELKEKENALAKSKDALFQTEKMASIGQLAAGVAHEINNPLGFVSSNMATLQTYIDPIRKILESIDALNVAIEAADGDLIAVKGKEIAQLVIKSDLEFVLEDINDLAEESLQGLERIKKIVMDLKLYARKESDEMAEADVNSVIDSAINIVWNQIKYNCELKKEYAELPMVQANVQQLSQVFVNLLVNAGHAIGDSGTLTVKSFVDGDCVQIEVSDTGKGIPEDIIEKIFDPLFTTKDPGKGTGLGLSISYEIIQRHKGTLTVESKPGEGTTFTIKLPVSKEN